MIKITFRKGKNPRTVAKEHSTYYMYVDGKRVPKTFIVSLYQIEVVNGEGIIVKPEPCVGRYKNDGINERFGVRKFWQSLSDAKIGLINYVAEQEGWTVEQDNLSLSQT